MDLVQAVVLAIVQGLSEFLPISSSGHLILVPHFFGWADQGLAFDVAVHVGTLLAVLVYFRRELVTMAAAWFGSVFRRRAHARQPARVADPGGHHSGRYSPGCCSTTSSRRIFATRCSSPGRSRSSAC